MRRFTIPREGYYSSLGYTLLAEDKSLGIEVWGSELKAMAFHGKANKPDWHYNFRSTERRDAKIAEHLAAYRSHADRKATERKEKAEWQHGLKVGDIFSSSWGYDQTNIDYYEIVAVHGKAVDVCEIAHQSEDTAWLQGNCVPSPGKYISKPRRMIPQRNYNGEPILAVRSFCHAHLEKPAIVAGVPVFQEKHWTAYA